MSVKGQLADTSAVRRSMKPVVFSTVAGIIVCALILFVLSLVITARDVPQSMIDPMATFAVSVGGLVSGFACARIMRVNGLVYGAVCGLALFLVVLVVSLFVSDAGLGVPGLFKLVFIVISSCIGGVMGVNTKKRGR